MEHFVDLMGFNGIQWNLMRFDGISWDFMGFDGDTLWQSNSLLWKIIFF
jgi:hypothetical protein